ADGGEHGGGGAEDHQHHGEALDAGAGAETRRQPAAGDDHGQRHRRKRDHYHGPAGDLLPAHQAFGGGGHGGIGFAEDAAGGDVADLGEDQVAFGAAHRFGEGGGEARQQQAVDHRALQGQPEQHQHQCRDADPDGDEGTVVAGQRGDGVAVGGGEAGAGGAPDVEGDEREAEDREQQVAGH